MKSERPTPDGLAHLRDIAPAAILVDCGVDPGAVHALLAANPQVRRIAPVVAVVPVDGLEPLPWEHVADELLLATAGAPEIRLRIAMLGARTGGLGDHVLRLGPLTIDTEAYQVRLAGRLLDLTYKEFELLRFLVAHPGRVYTREGLLHEVWGYAFYGGTRTVDVHVRRLRAKLGVEHESLIETVRGVGYRAAEPPL